LVRIVIDTNVLVSALLTPAGLCGQVLDLIVESILRPCMDERILAEYEEVLTDPRFPFTAEQVSTLLEMLRSMGERVVALPLASKLPHEADRPFLEVARAADAAIVTGNARHFPKRTCKGVPVRSPRDVIEGLRGE